MSATSTPRDSQPAAVVWHSDLLKYRFSAEHPMAPLRLDLTHRLIESFDLLSGEDVRIIEPPVATDEQLALVHDPEYVAAVRRAAATSSAEDGRFGVPRILDEE